MHNNLPDGFTVRPATLDDAEIVAALHKVSTPERSYGEIYTPDTFRMDWTLPYFQIDTSTRLILAADGTLAGFMVVWDRRDPPVRPALRWITHPAYDDGALMRWLVEWALERAKQAIPRCPADVRVSAVALTKHGYRPYEALYEALGFRLTHNYLQMRLDLTEAPEVTPLPAGFVLRPYRHPDDLRGLVEARQDVFRDHYGFVERANDEVYTDWRHEIDHDTTFDPTLWYLADDAATGQIAGFVLGKPEAFDEPDVAYVELVGVRRECRGRGLAAALLQHSFGEFWRRGRHSIALHVDSESTTGANRLYERVGMHVSQHHAEYERELRPGIDPLNRA